jgi:hypothetical protein
MEHTWLLITENEAIKGAKKLIEKLSKERKKEYSITIKYDKKRRWYQRYILELTIPEE